MFGRLTALCEKIIAMVMVSIGGLLLLAACSVGVHSSRNSADAESSLASFEQDVHPLFEQMGCAGCHITGKSGNGAFADENISVAHEAAKQRVSFSDIENSKLVTKQTGESPHDCSGECKTRLIAALTEWKKNSDSTAEESSSNTEAINADTAGAENTDADQENYTHILQFPITHRIDGSTAHSSVILTVSATKSSTVNTLTLKDFKITTTHDKIFLGGLKAKRNEQYHHDNTTRHICALVEANSIGKPLPFGEIVFSLGEVSTPNIIVFSLYGLRVATSSDTCGEKKEDPAALP